MRTLLSLSLAFSLFYFWVSLCNAQEVITTEDYIEDMNSFDRDSGTRVTGTRYQTGHKNNPGTYDVDIDLQSQMSISEINAGFDLEYGVTVKSHGSNAVLQTCTSITQNSDCRDIFKLTLSLIDANEVVQTFQHEVELDFSGNRDYTYNQTIEPNLYQSLTGNFQLYGVDAGYPSGWFGPEFSDPFLTSTWEVTNIINEEILTLLEHSDILDTDTNYDSVNVSVEGPEGDIMQEYTIEVEHDMDMAMTTDVNMDMDIDIQQDFDVPIVEDFDIPDTMTDIGGDMQDSPMSIEMNVETEMEMELDLAELPEPEISVEPDVQEQPTEPEVAEVEPETIEPENETQPERTEEVEEERENEIEVAEREPEAEPESTSSDVNNEADEDTEESETREEPTKKEKVVAEAKQKVANKIVKSMGDKGRYDSTNQIKRLVVMQVLGNANSFFENQKLLQDTPDFFDNTIVPDNAISDSNYAQYILFGGSDAAHSELIDSQYKE